MPAVGMPGWYMGLVILGVAAAFFTKSIVLNIGVIILCTTGVGYARAMTGVSETVKYGVVAVLLLLAGFAVFQLIYKVDKL